MDYDRLSGAGRGRRVGGPPILPPNNTVPVIGWAASPVTDVNGLAAHPNTGTLGTGFGNYPRTHYAGVVGYTSGTVVWVPSWSGETPAPTYDTSVPGRIGVILAQRSGSSFNTVVGLLTLTATLDGVSTAVGQGIVLATALAGYGFTASWGPE